MAVDSNEYLEILSETLLEITNMTMVQTANTSSYVSNCLSVADQQTHMATICN
jgi:hypothetical protein